MVTILGLRAFTSVVDHQGFAAAARKMGVSRSIINKRVITLENDLGVQLLRRSTRHIGLTDTGRCFYDRSLAILNELDEAVDSVKEMQEQPRGQLRINAPMSFGTLYLSQIVAEYMQHYPQVNVELVLNDRHIDPEYRCFKRYIARNPRVLNGCSGQVFSQITAQSGPI